MRLQKDLNKDFWSHFRKSNTSNVVSSIALQKGPQKDLNKKFDLILKRKASNYFDNRELVFFFSNVI